MSYRQAKEITLDESVPVQTHLPCAVCGSSDASAIYSDGHEYCFSCNHYTHGQEGEDRMEETRRAEGLLTYGEARELPRRKLGKRVCAMYGYLAGNGKHIAEYRRSNKVVAQHIREKNKKFYWVNAQKNLELFGQHLWAAGGKSLIITEGELDALSWAQARDHKWPVVAVPGTSSMKMVKDNYDFITSFSEIYLSFDADDAGQNFAEKVAAILPSGKTKIIHMPTGYKDASEVLIGLGESALYNTLWQAKVWQPDEILTFDQALEEGVKESGNIMTGKTFIDDLTKGMSLGHLVMIGAGSNIGKSLLIKHIAASMSASHKIGFFALEEGVGRVSSLLADIPDTNPENILFFKDQGRDLDSTVLNRIEFMATGMDVKVFFIDHITSILNQSCPSVTEIDGFLQDLQALALRLNVLLIYNSHVKDPDKGKYEDGTMPSSSSFRGSGMIYRVADIVLVLGRDIKHPVKKRVTRIECLKHRDEGLQVGLFRHYTLDIDNNQLTTIEPEFIDDDEDEGDDSYEF